MEDKENTTMKGKDILKLLNGLEADIKKRRDKLIEALMTKERVERRPVMKCIYCKEEMRYLGLGRVYFTERETVVYECKECKMRHHYLCPIIEEDKPILIRSLVIIEEAIEEQGAQGDHK